MVGDDSNLRLREQVDRGGCIEFGGLSHNKSIGAGLLDSYYRLVRLRFASHQIE